jgi:hypothetical protein
VGEPELAEALLWNPHGSQDRIYALGYSRRPPLAVTSKYSGLFYLKATHPINSVVHRCIAYILNHIVYILNQVRGSSLLASPTL